MEIVRYPAPAMATARVSRAGDSETGRMIGAELLVDTQEGPSAQRWSYGGRRRGPPAAAATKR